MICSGPWHVDLSCDFGGFMTKFIAVFLLLAGFTAASLSPLSAGASMHKGYEIPDFTVTAAEGPFELRRYEPHLVAAVYVEGARSTAIRRGFRMLAGYIFGKNVAETKISMTAPVAQTAQEDAWRVEFMMPKSYDLSALPAPNDDRIRFRQTDAETQAVIRFSGRWTEKNLAKKTAELRAWADARGLTLADAPNYYFYDDPFTWPGQRRNEVAFRVE